jgi:hypothetical protein
MTSVITVSQAVDMLFCGRSNLIKAAKAADVDPNILKRLLLERVKSSPTQAPLQLTLDLR